jgi:1-acyl-sn-glycerol-3-phosphate acyltransferase
VNGTKLRGERDAIMALLDLQARQVRLLRRFSGEWLLFLVARLLGGWRVVGEAGIPNQGACIFPFNHVTPAADLVVNTLIRQHRPQLHIFAEQGLAGENPLAFFLNRLGEHDTEARLLRAYKAKGLAAGELLAAYRIVCAGGAVSIAAEGEMTWDGRLQHPLMPGAAWLALRTAAPVVPVVSVGGYDVQPRWQMDRLRLPTRGVTRVGQPIYLSETPQQRPDCEAVAAANQRLWEAMAALLAEGYTATDRIRWRKPPRATE